MRTIRTTVTLDEDVIERVKRESRSRGASLRDTVNELLRGALLNLEKRPLGRKVKIRPTHMGYRPFDSIEAFLEMGEGERHRWHQRRVAPDSSLTKDE